MDPWVPSIPKTDSKDFLPNLFLLFLLISSKSYNYDVLECLHMPLGMLVFYSMRLIASALNVIASCTPQTISPCLLCAGLHKNEDCKGERSFIHRTISLNYWSGCKLPGFWLQVISSHYQNRFLWLCNAGYGV